MRTILTTVPFTVVSACALILASGCGSLSGDHNSILKDTHSSSYRYLDKDGEYKHGKKWGMIERNHDYPNIVADKIEVYRSEPKEGVIRFCANGGNPVHFVPYFSAHLEDNLKLPAAPQKWYSEMQTSKLDSLIYCEKNGEISRSNIDAKAFATLEDKALKLKAGWEYNLSVLQVLRNFDRTDIRYSLNRSLGNWYRGTMVEYNLVTLRFSKTR